MKIYILISILLISFSIQSQINSNVHIIETKDRSIDNIKIGMGIGNSVDMFFIVPVVKKVYVGASFGESLIKPTTKMYKDYYGNSFEFTNEYRNGMYLGVIAMYDVFNNLLLGGDIGMIQQFSDKNSNYENKISVYASIRAAKNLNNVIFIYATYNTKNLFAIGIGFLI